MNKYQAIIDSYVNGQKRQCIEMINEFGWYEFVDHLQHDHTIDVAYRLEMLCCLIRINNR